MKNEDQLNHCIGVVGGGQLAQMLAIAARGMSVEVLVQTGSEQDPAVANADGFILADTNDINGTRKLSQLTKCVTFENEWIDTDTLSSLEDVGVKFIPNLSSMKPLVNKLSQRKLLNRLNIPGPDWIPLSSYEGSVSIDNNLWPFPLMAKSSIGGYDGKGTRVLRNESDLKQLLKSVHPNDWFLEKWVNYEKELSLVISRDLQGNVKIFPLTETFQCNQICDWVMAPANVAHQVSSFAKNIAISLVRELNYYGVLAIEFFYGDEGLLVNEIAPRTHNSAHFTIEACKSNQFQHQIAIASGISMPQPELISPGAIMVNLLGFEDDGSLSERLSLLKDIPGLSVHWYNKTKNHPGRKLGHVTKLLTATNKDQLRIEAGEIHNQIRTIWPIT